MKIQDFLRALVNWFIPDKINREDVEAFSRSQMIVAFCILIIPFHIGPILRYKALGSSLYYLNIGHMAIAVSLLILFKFTGFLRFVGATVSTTLFFQVVLSAILVSGLNSNILSLCIVFVVSGILVVGYRFGVFAVTTFSVVIFGIYFLQKFGVIDAIPPYVVSKEKLLFEKYYYLTAGMIAYTLFVIIFHGTKRNAFRIQKEEEEKTVQMAGDLQRLIDDVSVNFSALAAHSEELSQTSREMENNTSLIVQSEKETSETISQSASVTQDFSVSLKKITRLMRMLRKLVSSAEEEGRFGSSIIQEADSVMDRIEEVSKRVEGITEVISEIAEQTKLLSLNAAIEADKAGELGQGFAIVAEEVGGLAKRSDESAVRINDVVQNSRAVIVEGKNTINETGRLLGDIIAQIGDAVSQINQIVTAMTEEDKGTREIAVVSSSIAKISFQNSILINRLADTIEESNKSIADLGAIAVRLEDKALLYRS